MNPKITARGTCFIALKTKLTLQQVHPYIPRSWACLGRRKATSERMQVDILLASVRKGFRISKKG
jgi:hypothetical protein